MTPLPLHIAELAVDEADALAREGALLGAIAGLGPTIVAFSGGVDSTYVAWAAARALGAGALAITAFSDSFPEARRPGVVDLASEIGIAHRVVHTRETEDPRYLANNPDRCYWCKDELYRVLAAMRRAQGFATVIDGTNADDLGDHRPGRRAAAEQGVRSPLVDAGLSKAAIRWLSRRAGLPTWHEPASPCLSSRVPHGDPIDATKLRAIDRAESAVRALGLREFRVRHLGGSARLEVAAEELDRAREPVMASTLVAAIVRAGFAVAEIDREPFRSGRLSRPAAPGAG